MKQKDTLKHWWNSIRTRMMLMLLCVNIIIIGILSVGAYTVYQAGFLRELSGSRADVLRQIGERVGFSDVNNFIRCFRRQTGLSPTQYRKGWRNLPQGQAMKPE